MNGVQGKKYGSRWDWGTWIIIAIVMACCLSNCFFEDSIWPFVLSAVMLVFIITCFLSIYYVIDGDELVVYQGFTHKSYPIAKIKEIKPTKLRLSAPAAAVTKRIAITFTDRSILKSSIPLILSPKRQKEFIARLIAVNPEIILDKELDCHT